MAASDNDVTTEDFPESFYTGDDVIGEILHPEKRKVFAIKMLIIAICLNGQRPVSKNLLQNAYDMCTYFLAKSSIK